MNRDYLISVVEKHSDRIRKHLDKLPGAFDPEEIHKFRVEYKKLRAFLRLLAYDAPHLGGIPHGWKAIYKRAGRVRDLQLYLPQLEGWLPGQAPVIMNRQRALFLAKEKLVKALESNPLSKGLDHILSALPDRLTDEGLQRYLQRQLAALHILLLALETDEDYHAIRKILKDFMYIIRIYDREWGISCPISQWKSEKALDDLTTSLGDYNDLGQLLNKLDDEITTASSADEQALLIEEREKRLDAKREMRSHLTQQLQGLKPAGQRSAL